MLNCELNSLEYKGDLVLEGLDYNDNLGYLLKFKRINTPSNSYCVDCEVSLVIPRKKATIYMFTYSFVNSTDMSFYDFVESVKGRVLNKFSGNIETIQKFLDIYNIQNTKKSINIDTVYAKPKKEVNIESDVEVEKGIPEEKIETIDDLRKKYCPEKMSFDEFLSSQGLSLGDLDSIFKPFFENGVEKEIEDKKDEDVSVNKEDMSNTSEEETEFSFDTFPDFLKLFGIQPEKIKKVENSDIEKALKTGAEVLLNSFLQGIEKVNQTDKDVNKDSEMNNMNSKVKVNKVYKSEKSPLEREGDKMYAWLKENGYTLTNNEYLFIQYCRQYLYAVGIYDSRIGNYLLRYCLNKFRTE